MNGTATIPIARTNAFDSSGTEIIPIAFLSGSPFPGSVIPESRIDPVALTALAAMPSPNVPTAGTSTGAFQTTTSVQPGATVEIDGQNNSGFASFAGWLAIPYAPYLNERTTTLELFIDGNLVATLEVPYNTMRWIYLTVADGNSETAAARTSSAGSGATRPSEPRRPVQAADHALGVSPADPAPLRYQV